MGIKGFYYVFDPIPLNQNDDSYTCGIKFQHVYVDFNNCYGKYLQMTSEKQESTDVIDHTQKFCLHLYSLIKPLLAVESDLHFVLDSFTSRKLIKIPECLKRDYSNWRPFHKQTIDLFCKEKNIEISVADYDADSLINFLVAERQNNTDEQLVLDIISFSV